MRGPGLSASSIPSCALGNLAGKVGHSFSGLALKKVLVPIATKSEGARGRGAYFHPSIYLPPRALHRPQPFDRQTDRQTGRQLLLP